ncbi:hypothetical protein BFP72_10920 [Reichenbachiella sp. 5M10]|uniref:DUF1569 domain-containing protein n=1 Tax=Reichenbachiella sp. 5M10 TaxID=1889772 RepID=UPI000C1627B9|nr:DUF1569 domain-containing protein [Reichenbachiella sp. 5M10]PIB35869.1 hypothetical protein BFP72_10920 [Reichenbachiella sp. 5M10]
MKTIFDQNVLSELQLRIDHLSPQATAAWGKMNTYQMLRHCILSERMFLGDNEYKRLFIGRLFGKVALKGILKNDNPLKENQPTHPAFKITGQGDIVPLKNNWKTLLERYSTISPDELAGFLHPFFGAMTRDQIGQYVYKHTDHHLRQFKA